MTKIFTHDDLLTYLYNELPEKERKTYEDHLICDQNDLDQFSELSSVKEKLDGLRLNPPKRSIQKILNFSNSFNLHSVKK